MSGNGAEDKVEATKVELHGEIEALPVFSRVAARLATMLDEKNSTFSDFAGVIKHDAGLTATLLKLTNSAYFGVRRTVTTVDQAVALLGRKRMFEMVVAASFSRVIPPKIPGYHVTAEEYWRHNAATAILAEAIAERVGRSSSEVFTAALIHDCGRLLIGPMLERRSTELAVRASLGEPFVQVERDLLDTDHTEAGAVLARKWRLPQAVRWAARWHHSPEQAPWFTDPQLAGIVHVAAAAAHQFGYGKTVDEWEAEISGPVVDSLGFSGPDIETVGRAAAGAIDSLGQMLDAAA